MREEALKGARPMGALLMVKSEAHAVLLKELIASQVITPEELLFGQASSGRRLVLPLLCAFSVVLNPYS
eukprot:s2165_g7.t1